MVRESLDSKLYYLKRLLALYVLFTRKWNKVSVEQTVGEFKGKKVPTITIKYYDPTDRWYLHSDDERASEFEMKEFSLSHLSKIIIRYKNKVANEFKNRHSNTALKKKYQVARDTKTNVTIDTKNG